MCILRARADWEGVVRCAAGPVGGAARGCWLTVCPCPCAPVPPQDEIIPSVDADECTFSPKINHLNNQVSLSWSCAACLARPGQAFWGARARARAAPHRALRASAGMRCHLNPLVRPALCAPTPYSCCPAPPSVSSVCATVATVAVHACRRHGSQSWRASTRRPGEPCVRLLLRPFLRRAHASRPLAHVKPADAFRYAHHGAPGRAGFAPYVPHAPVKGGGRGPQARPCSLLLQLTHQAHGGCCRARRMPPRHPCPGCSRTPPTPTRPRTHAHPPRRLAMRSTKSVSHQTTALTWPSSRDGKGPTPQALKTSRRRSSQSSSQARPCATRPPQGLRGACCACCVRVRVRVHRRVCEATSSQLCAVALPVLSFAVATVRAHR